MKFMQRNRPRAPRNHSPLPDNSGRDNEDDSAIRGWPDLDCAHYFESFIRPDNGLRLINGLEVTAGLLRPPPEEGIVSEADGEDVSSSVIFSAFTNQFRFVPL